MTLQRTQATSASSQRPDGDLDREQQLVDMLRNGSVDGLVIFSPTMLDGDVNTVAEQLSVVQVCEIVDAEAAFGVLNDDRQAAHDITKHLIDTGAKKLAMLAHRGARSGRLREEGFRLALKEAGLDEDQILLGGGNFGFHAGRNLTKKLLGTERPPRRRLLRPRRPAAGCVRELTDAGLRVPDDIAVAGFDDSVQAKCASQS